MSEATFNLLRETAPATLNGSQPTEVEEEDLSRGESRPAFESDATDSTVVEPHLSDPSATHSWIPVDLVAAAATPPEPPTIGGVVYPARRHVFSGEPESPKSWAVLALALEEMRAGRNVFYIDFEMGQAETLERLTQLGASHELIRARLTYIEPSEAMVGAGILGDVRTLIETRQPSLVVIDAFSGALAVHGYDENKNSDVERFHREVVDTLRAHGAAVVILDHLTKDKEARGKYAIGAGRKIGAADVHLRFELLQPFGRGKTGRAKLETKKDRPGHLRRPRAAELELVSDPATGTITYTLTIADDMQNDGSFRPTVLMERVSIYVEGCPAAIPRDEIETNVKGHGPSKRIALDVLIREGYIVEEIGLKGARLNRSARPYREVDELVQSSSTAERHEYTARPSSSMLVQSSSKTRSSTSSMLVPPPTGGREQDGDEVERLQGIAQEMGLCPARAKHARRLPHAPARQQSWPRQLPPMTLRVDQRVDRRPQDLRSGLSWRWCSVAVTDALSKMAPGANLPSERLRPPGLPPGRAAPPFGGMVNPMLVARVAQEARAGCQAGVLEPQWLTRQAEPSRPQVHAKRRSHPPPCDSRPIVVLWLSEAFQGKSGLAF